MAEVFRLDSLADDGASRPSFAVVRSEWCEIPRTLEVERRATLLDSRLL
jgi:hypothetical protein